MRTGLWNWPYVGVIKFSLVSNNWYATLFFMNDVVLSIFCLFDNKITWSSSYEVGHGWCTKPGSWGGVEIEWWEIIKNFVQVRTFSIYNISQNLSFSIIFHTSFFVPSFISNSLLETGAKKKGFVNRNKRKTNKKIVSR